MNTVRALKRIKDPFPTRFKRGDPACPALIMVDYFADLVLCWLGTNLAAAQKTSTKMEPWQAETWTKTSGLPILFNFEPPIWYATLRVGSPLVLWGFRWAFCEPQNVQGRRCRGPPLSGCPVRRLAGVLVGDGWGRPFSRDRMGMTESRCWECTGRGVP